MKQAQRASRSSSHNQSDNVFPTESRLRAKERAKDLKARGLKPKKRQKVTEPGNDDCGDNLSGLGKDIILLMQDVTQEDIESSDDEIVFIAIPMAIHDAHTNIYSAIAHLCYGKHNTVDLLELCGGEARISQVSFKRGLASGGDLDLVTGCDLGDPAVQRAVDHYLETCYVLVTVLQPNCRTTGRNSYYNSVMNEDTWKRHHEEDLPHITYCAKVALKQLSLKRFFLREQPVGTWIDEIKPWTQVHSDPTVVKVNMDQCMAGAKDDDGCPVKKPTEWTANSRILLLPMEKFKCNKMHDHAHPTGKALEKLKLYPWRLCEAVVTGIQNLKESLRRGRSNHSMYPTVGTGDGDVTEPPPPKVPFKGLGCPACWSQMRKESPQHSRNPRECHYPHVKEVIMKCPSCNDDRGRNSRRSDDGHTFKAGECRFADAERPPPPPVLSLIHI